MFATSLLSSIVDWWMPADPLTKIETLIDQLEKGEKIEVDSFGPLNEKHGNTYLLCALAWNRLRAAKTLLQLDKNKIALNQKDSWPTCRNTPLILAAKINAAEMVGQLIEAGARTDEQDHRGFTALHYACIYRNEEAIRKLLDAGASLNLQDAFGKLPLQYYLREITPDDLAYRYGLSETDATRLNPYPDCNDAYYATYNKCYSSLRWYIAHVLVNTKIDQDVGEGAKLQAYARASLNRRSPVDHAALYTAMLASFCAARPMIVRELAKQLKPSKADYAAYLDSYQPALTRSGLFGLIPDHSRHRDCHGRLSIEMQQLPAKSVKKIIM